MDYNNLEDYHRAVPLQCLKRSAAVPLVQNIQAVPQSRMY